MTERYTIMGRDAWGNPVSETVSVPISTPLTWRYRARNFIARWVFNGSYPLIGVWLHNFGWRHGFHRWRMITSIEIETDAQDAE